MNIISNTEATDDGRVDHPLPRSKFRWLLATVLCLLVVVALYLLAMPTEAETGPELEAKRMEVRVSPVLASDERVVMRRYLGQVDALRSSDLSFELGGRLASIFVEEGAQIEAGDPLATLDTARLKASQRTLKARIEEAQATEALAKLRSKRTEQLINKNAISTQEHDDSLYAYKISQAATKRIQAEIEAIEVELAKSTLYAPYPGVISRRYLDEGSVVANGQAVLRLLDDAGYELRIALPSREWRQLKVGDTVVVETESDSQSLSISRRSSERDPITRTLDVYLDAAVLSDSLVEGDLVDVLLPEATSEQGLWVPQSALIESTRGLWALLMIEPTESSSEGRIQFGVISRVTVEVLRIDGDWVQIDGALDTDLLVVSEGRHRVVPGQAVRYISKGAAR